jgi:NIPSNAP
MHKLENWIAPAAGQGATRSDATKEGDGACSSLPIVELRQYTLHEGKRDVLIELFEREFVESQEAAGMTVIGTFVDLDRPDRFVWVRGFSDMDTRLEALTRFYDGPVWKAHRSEANATMVDSDNVLLLSAPAIEAEFDLPARRPRPGESSSSALVTVTIHHLKVPQDEAVNIFESRVKLDLAAAGINPIGWFATSTAENNFSRLPVRESGRVLVWFAAYVNEAEFDVNRIAVEAAVSPLAPFLDFPDEVLRLRPTSRSLVRGPSVRSGEHDFDFLHGRWTVKHRRLNERGVGSNEWSEFEGSAETRSLLGGTSNIEEHRIPAANFSGIALRCFDRAAERWAIYWVSERDGRLQPPVFGHFDGKTGTFEGEDLDDGRPVRVRFLWVSNTALSARWEQAFSYDGGNSWETNWTMDFKRNAST